MIGGSGALVVLLFAAAIASQQGTARELEQAQAQLVEARVTVTAHATTMRTQGARLLAVAQGSKSAHQAHWTDDARAMIADAARLDATVSLLAAQAALLGEHPGASVRSDLGYVHTAGNALVAEGEQLAAHARSMREHSLAMEELARTSETDIAQSDAALLRDGAERVSDAGERTRSIGVALRDVGTQLMRSLGR